MKKLRFIIFVFVLTAFPSLNSYAQTGRRAIDAYCKTIEAVQKKRKNPDLIAADISDINTGEETWRAFRSAGALDKFRETTETYIIAYNWKSKGRIAASNLTLFSPSGDWVKYVYQCYRTDGTLARVASDYRTFNGDFTVLRKRYFARNGKQISSSVKFLDLKTRRPKAAPDGVMGDDPNDTEYYMTTANLPFKGLLKK